MTFLEWLLIGLYIEHAILFGLGIPAAYWWMKRQLPKPIRTMLEAPK